MCVCSTSVHVWSKCFGDYAIKGVPKCFFLLNHHIIPSKGKWKLMLIQLNLFQIQKVTSVAFKDKLSYEWASPPHPTTHKSPDSRHRPTQTFFAFRVLGKWHIIIPSSHTHAKNHKQVLFVYSNLSSYRIHHYHPENDKQTSQWRISRGPHLARSNDPRKWSECRWPTTSSLPSWSDWSKLVRCRIAKWSTPFCIWWVSKDAYFYISASVICGVVVVRIPWWVSLTYIFLDLV